MKFLFKAKTQSGEVREGVVEALNEDGAIKTLQRNGLVPLTLSEDKPSRSSVLKSFEHLWEGASQKELMVFFQQLATLIEARVPIVTSLSTIGDQTENRYMRRIVKEMADDVQEGMPFSEALQKHPETFTALNVNMIRAGEISGTLHKSVTFVAANIEKNYQLSSKIKGALYYPAFVLTVAFIIGFLVITFILPKITILIKDLQVPVPWYTSVLIWLGDFMNNFWWAVLIVLIGALAGFYHYVHTESGRREWELILLKLPVIGNLARNIYITRLAENLSALLNSGIPVVNALVIVKEVIGNHVFERMIDQAIEEVKAGGSMSTVFVRAPEMPPIVSQMMRIGEETGTLSGVLESVAKFYTQEVENMTRSLTTLIEPMLIVILGIGVGILVIGVLLPIYNLAGQL